MNFLKGIITCLMIFGFAATNTFASPADAAAPGAEVVSTGSGSGHADSLHADIQKVLMDIQQVEKKMGERLRVLRENNDRAKALLDELGRIKTRQFEIEQELNGMWQQDKEYTDLEKQRDELKASMDELFTTNAGKKDN
jgi:predicted  nucleic acid-binding Zn-ribbon protein